MFLIPEFSFSQKNNEKLPYRKIPKYSGEINYGLVISRIIDELGYTYYWASKGLKIEDLKNEQGSSNILYSLLENVNLVSNVIASQTLNQSILEITYKEKDLDELRKETLFNFKKASMEMYKRTDTANLPLWEILSEPISDITWYNKQIISYRRENDIPVDQRVYLSKQEFKDEIFERKIGADGITNNQWMYISSLKISSLAKSNLIGKQRSLNSATLVIYKKQREVYLEVGDLEDVSLEPNIVDGKEYLFIGDPPNKISLNISSDRDFINELIQWIVYINSGNEVGFEEIFRVNKYKGINNELLFLNVKNIRNFVDNHGNSIKFEIFSKNSNKKDLFNYNITRVLVTNSGQDENLITFYGKNNKDAQGQVSQEIKIMYISNIEGSLLTRVIQNIDYYRDYRNEAPDPPLLDLSDR